jgi:two-component system cell cycle response regulator
LTGAVNRSVFERKLRETLRNAMKNGTSLSLLMLDIDHFKLINDTWGHDVGDLVLREFTKLCDSNLRATDVLARIGGEEFAILLPETDRKMAAVIGERIRTAIEEKKFKGPDHTVSITTSVGCTSCNGKIKTTPEILCKTADHALYTAKRTGRNLFVYQSSLVGDCALEH